MNDFRWERRGLFNGLSVPFLDASAILVATLAILSFQLGVSILSVLAASELRVDGVHELSTGGQIPLTSIMIGQVLGKLGPAGRVIAETFHLPIRSQPLSLLLVLGFWTWTALVWSFFAGALCRNAALRLARDDSLGIGEALAFGLGRFRHNLFAIFGVTGVVLFLSVGVNSFVLGSLSRIPWVGDVLLPILYLVALALSLVVAFITTLSVLGFNLTAAAIATEMTDAFEGISRSWSYISRSSWAFLLCSAMLYISIGLGLIAIDATLRHSVASMSFGSMGLGRGAWVAGPEESSVWLRGSSAELEFQNREAIFPQRGEYLYRRVVEAGPRSAGLWKGQGGLARFERQFLQMQPDGQERDVLQAVRNDGVFFYSVETVSWIVSITRLVMLAVIVNLFFAGQTTIYFLLRREIDGEDYNEITMSGEDQDFSAPEVPVSEVSPSRFEKPGPEKQGPRNLPMVMEV